jgi:hypothetical protein
MYEAPSLSCTDRSAFKKHDDQVAEQFGFFGRDNTLNLAATGARATNLAAQVAIGFLGSKKLPTIGLLTSHLADVDFEYASFFKEY